MQKIILILVVFFISIFCTTNCSLRKKEKSYKDTNSLFEKGGCFSEEGFVVYYEFDKNKYISIYSDTLNFGEKTYNQFHKVKRKLSVDIDDFSRNEIIHLPYCSDIVNLDGFESYAIQNGEVRIKMNLVSDSIMNFSCELMKCTFKSKNNVPQLIDKIEIKPFKIYYQPTSG